MCYTCFIYFLLLNIQEIYKTRQLSTISPNYQSTVRIYLLHELTAEQW